MTPEYSRLVDTASFRQRKAHEIQKIILADCHEAPRALNTTRLWSPARPVTLRKKRPSLVYVGAFQCQWLRMWNSLATEAPARSRWPIARAISAAFREDEVRELTFHDQGISRRRHYCPGARPGHRSVRLRAGALPLRMAFCLRNFARRRISHGCS